MEELLKMQIAPKRRLVIVKDIQTINVYLRDRDRESTKVEIMVIDQAGMEFNVSDAWFESKRGKKKQIKGLWLVTFTNKDGKTEISPASAFARLLQYYNAKTPEELLGMEVTVYPDDDGFSVLQACDMGKD